MANTYTQIHIQFVFAVKYRDTCIDILWREELFQYITGIIKNNNHKLIIINGMPDHIHILIGVRPVQAISELVQLIKTNSSKWINEKRFVKGKFEWQEGYGAFSYGKSQVNIVVGYIKNQQEHHKKVTFKEEYIDFLNKFEIDYDEKFIFKDLL
jgi:putative transposase